MKFNLTNHIYPFSWAISLLLFAGCQKDERGMIVGKIQQASDLVTSEFVVDKVVFGKKSRNILFVPVNEASFLAYSKARVKTGINLNEIAEKDILISGKKITVHLPSIEVINFSYPPEDFIEDTLISDPTRFLNHIDLEDQEYFFRQAELDIRENLPHMGLVKTSQENTRLLMHTLLSGFGFEEIYIHFKDDQLVIPQVDYQNNTSTP